MGTAAEFMIMPYGSLIVGFFCGILSVFGYIFITVSLAPETGEQTQNYPILLVITRFSMIITDISPGHILLKLTIGEIQESSVIIFTTLFFFP